MLQKYVPFPPGNQAGIFIRVLCPMVQEKIHLQETLFDLGVFDLDPKVKVT